MTVQKNNNLSTMKKEVKVRTFPSASKEKLLEITREKHSNILENVRMFEVYVREPAQRNLANTRVRELLAEHFGVPTTDVIIKAGHRSRNKILEIK